MNKITIHEVGPRDGIQIEEKIVPLEKKVAWILGLVDSGIRKIQVGSFVHPQRVPQMADTDKVFQHLRNKVNLPDDLVLSGLVLNERGLERGLACGVDLFCMGVSASETHSLKNSGKSCNEAMNLILDISRKAENAGKKVQLTVQNAFGCNYKGVVKEDKVISFIEKYLEHGASQINLADTSGLATPFQVSRLFETVFALAPTVQWGCHFHEASGFGLANCYAAVNAGVTVFESSFGGMGGCPFTATASGNVCTEDLIRMIPQEYWAKKIDIDKIAQISLDAQSFFERDLPGVFHQSKKFS